MLNPPGSRTATGRTGARRLGGGSYALIQAADCALSYYGVSLYTGG